MTSKTGTLALATDIQVALFTRELVGQLSDGAWENASPSDHWEAWANADVLVRNDGLVGRDFPVRKDGYAFAAQLIEVVGDRMIAIGREFDADYDEAKLRADLAAISKAMKAQVTFPADAQSPEAQAATDLEEVDLGPVVNADGTPTAATLEILTGSPVAAPDNCRGKWSACGGKNPAKSESWHLCQACTDVRKAAKVH